jgi:hypothetical protein
MPPPCYVFERIHFFLLLFEFANKSTFIFKTNFLEENYSISFLPGNKNERLTNTISEAVIPKIFGSRSNGNLMESIVSKRVVLPPTSIDQNAAIVLPRFQKNAPKTGINSPLTINA